MAWFAVLTLVAVLAKCGTQLWLDRLNQRHVEAHAGAVPEAFKETIDEPTYKKSVECTLAKGRFDQIEIVYGTMVLLVALFSGALPWGLQWFVQHIGSSAWAMAAFLFVTGIALSLPGLPLDWYGQFRLEQRFVFNTTTQWVWSTDLHMALLRGMLLGYA